MGFQNKQRRLHSCNKRGQAVRKKPKPNESIFVRTAALGFKSEPEHTDSTQSPFVFLHTTLTESGTTVHARTPTPPPARWLTAVVPVPENLCWQKLHLNFFFFTSYSNVTFPNSVSTTSNRSRSRGAPGSTCTHCAYCIRQGPNTRIFSTKF